MNFNMKTLSKLSLVAFSLVLFSCGADTAAKETSAAKATQAKEDAKKAASTELSTYVIDESSSTVNWTGSLLGVYDHSGTVNITSGHLDFKGNEIVGGNVTVDMATMTPTDANYSAESPKEGLIGHLSSPDFFDVANHPTASINIGPGGKSKLTVRGKTNEVEIQDVTLSKTDNGMSAKGFLGFDRTKYGVSFQKPGDKVISNEVQLEINLNLNQKK